MANIEVPVFEIAPQTEGGRPLGPVATAAHVELVGIPLDEGDVLFLNMPNQFLDQEKAPVAAA